MKPIRLILSSTFALLLLILLFSLNHQNVSAQDTGPVEQPNPFTLVITKTLPVGDDLIHGFIYDNGFLWAATRTSPARILKINSATLQVESSVILDAGLNNADAIAAADGFIWAILYTKPARLIRVNPSTMEWIQAITFPDSPNNPNLVGGESLDYAFNYLWVGGEKGLAKVNVNDLTYQIYDFSNLNNQGDTGIFVALTHDVNNLWGTYLQYSNTTHSYNSTIILKMDPANPQNAPATVNIPVTFPDDMVSVGGFAYTSSEINPVQSSPSKIYKFPSDPSAFTPFSAADSASYGLFHSFLETQYFWGVYVGSPGIIKKFDLESNEVTSITLPPGLDDPSEMAFDAAGNVYVSTWQSPSKIAKYASQYPVDLSLEMFGQSSPVKTGDTLTYTLNVVNNSLNEANDVKVVDNLPGDVSLISSSPGSGVCHNLSGQVTCSLGTLAANTSTQIALQIMIGTPAGISLHNTALVSTLNFDPNPTNNQASWDTPYVPPSADLSLAMLREPATVKASDFMTYTITATNQGPDAAPDVKVIDTLPSGVSFISSSPGTINCLNQAGQVDCSVGTLAASASAQIKLRVQVVSPAGTSLHNTAEVSANVSDPISSNNQAAVDTTYVPPSADLSLAMTGAPGMVTAGDFMTYTITTSNQGPEVAPDVKIIDTLPAGVSFISSLPASIVCQNQAPQVTCSLGALSSGASAQVTLRVQVGSPGGSTLHNSAQVSANVSDPVGANNQASVDTAYVPGNPPGNPRVYLPVIVKLK